MAIAHDATTTDASGASHSSRTTAHTCNGSNRYLLVATTGRQSAGQTVSSVTYGGVALTRIDGTNQGTNTIRHELWGLIAPATGANNVVVTWSASVAAASYVVNSYTGVHQTTATGTPGTASGLSTAPTVDVSSASGELVVDAVGWRENSTGSVGAGQTLRGQVSAGSGSSFTETACSEEAGAATVTMSWTLGASVSWGLVAVPLKPASSSTTFTQSLSATSTASASTAKHVSAWRSSSSTGTASRSVGVAKAQEASSTSVASRVVSVIWSRSSSSSVAATVRTAVAKALAGSSTGSATSARTVNLPKSAELTGSSTLSRAVAAALSASSSQSASVVRVVSVSLSGTVSVAASAVKRVGRSLSATASSTASLVSELVALVLIGLREGRGHTSAVDGAHVGATGRDEGSDGSTGLDESQGGGSGRAG